MTATLGRLGAMPPRALFGRALAMGSLAGLAYAIFEATRLTLTYPMHHDTVAPCSTAWLWPQGLGTPAEVRALTRLGRGADARETLIAAFYSTWTLRIEALMSRTFNLAAAVALPPAAQRVRKMYSAGLVEPGSQADRAIQAEFASRPAKIAYTPPPTPATPPTTPPTPDLITAPGGDLPAAYASGLFQVLGRTDDATMVWWGDGAFGGAQLIAISRLPSRADSSKLQNVQISMTCAETPFLGDDLKGWIGTAFHQLYMRFLVDRAARRMEKWARASE